MSHSSQHLSQGSKPGLHGGWIILSLEVVGGDGEHGGACEALPGREKRWEMSHCS